MKTQHPTLIAFAYLLCGAALAGEVDDRAFAKALGKTLDRKVTAIRTTASGSSDAAAPAPEKSSGGGFEDDVDAYWDDEEPEAAATPAPSGPTGVSATYGALVIERLHFPQASEAATFAFEYSSAFSQSPLPLALEQRGSYIVVAYGKEISDPARALKVLAAAWRHTPAEGRVETRYAWLPNVGEVKSKLVTSSLDAMQFDTLERSLRPYRDQSQACSAGKNRALWLALDPNLSDRVRAYALAFLELEEGWREVR